MYLGIQLHIFALTVAAFIGSAVTYAIVNNNNQEVLAAMDGEIRVEKTLNHACEARLLYFEHLLNKNNIPYGG